MKTFFNLSAVALLAGTIAFAQRSSNEFPKLSGPYVGQKTPGLTPEVFAPGFISTGMDEAGATFSTDGKEFFFMVMANDHETIAVTRLVDGAWTRPEVAEFSGQYSDGWPSFQPGGSKLFFHSNRPLENGAKYNIWFVEKNGGGWGEPKPVGAPVNGGINSVCPSVAKSGTIYFSRQPKTGEEYIFRSRCVDGKYQEPEKLPPSINTRKVQFHASISPDESVLMLPLSGRPDAVGQGEDLYVSFRDDHDRWGGLINLGKDVNSLAIYGISSFSPDGKYFFFNAYPRIKRVDVYDKVMRYTDLQEMMIKYPAGFRTDIYWVDAKIIERLRPAGTNKG